MFNGFPAFKTAFLATLVSIRALIDTKLDKTDTAVSAQKLEQSRTINGQAFNGTGDVEIRRIRGLQEFHVQVDAEVIDLAQGNLFTKVISKNTALNVVGLADTGTVSSFTLELVNGGNFAVTLWPGVKWAGGVTPALTTNGTDVMGFFTHDGGVSWTGLLLAGDLR